MEVPACVPRPLPLPVRRDRRLCGTRIVSQKDVLWLPASSVTADRIAFWGLKPTRPCGIFQTFSSLLLNRESDSDVALRITLAHLYSE